MSQVSSPARYIREQVFGIPNQQAFAELLGVTQPQVSRWERGINHVSGRAQIRIRALARERGIAWNDAWFFEVPDGPVEGKAA